MTASTDTASTATASTATASTATAPITAPANTGDAVSHVPATGTLDARSTASANDAMGDASSNDTARGPAGLQSSGNPAATPDRLVAIDIGSNSVRLVVAQLLPSGDYRVLDEEREFTRLSRRLSATNRLSDVAMAESTAALRRLKKIAESYRAARLRVIATSAVREADNRHECIAAVRDELGLEIEVVDSHTEATLAFLSANRAFDLRNKNVVVADIGGGSTEIVFASSGLIDEVHATTLGAVRMTELYGEPEKLFSDDHEQLLQEIDAEVKRQVRKPPFIPHVLLGSGGTFTNLASMLIASKGHRGQPEWGYRVSRADVSHLLDKLRKMTLKQRRNVPGLNADRADIIVAGLAIIDSLMRRMHVNILQVHTGGVRDGLLLDMIREMRPDSQQPQDVAAAVEKFAQNCGVDLPHSKHVAHLAGMIFDQVAQHFHLDPADRPLLQYAAMLQDCGYLINYDSHHKHSYQLILNSQLPIHRNPLEIIANVARYHRGAKPKKKHGNFRRLPPEAQRKVKQLVGILRLAGGLDRSHTQHVHSVEVNIQEGETRLDIHASGDPEVDLWATRRRAKIFEKTFDTAVVVQAAS